MSIRYNRWIYKKKYMHGNIFVAGKKVSIARSFYNVFAFLARSSLFKVQDFILTNGYREFDIEIHGIQHINRATPAEGDVVIVVAADYDYTEKFAEQLIKSLHQHHSDDFFYCLHIVGGSRSDMLKIAETIRQFLGDDNFHLTWENNNLPHATYHNRRRYLQCIRFWHAREALYAWKRPVLVLDIDVVCRGNLDHYIHDFMKAGDVGLWERDHQYDPGKKILAGAVWLNPTSGAMAFLDRAVKRMFLHLAKAFFTRKLDQRSLYLAKKGLGNSISTFALPDGFISLHANDHCLLYAAEGTLQEKEEMLQKVLARSLETTEKNRKAVALQDSGA